MITFRQPFAGTYPITLDYDEVWEPTYPKFHPHKGIDYGCPLDTTIIASADGQVIEKGFAPNGYGNYIIIRHADGSGTVYAHLNRVYVITNQTVKQGDAIGLSGSTGNSTGPHLHFEMRTEADNITTRIDPKTKLQTFYDPDPDVYTPAPVKREFTPVRDGLAIVVCDVANARCHCDMNRVMKQLHKGDVISVGTTTTMYNGLPYRDYYDPDVNCWLRVAEHDPDTQILENYTVKEWDTVHYL